MSLGKPTLYINGQLMQTAAADPRPALAGLQIRWGNDSRLEMDPPSTLSGQLLIKGAMPSFLQVGAPVGLIDPISARCLFAGHLGPLQAAPAESIDGALRVSFTATSPLSELIKHKVVDVNWPMENTGPARFNQLRAAMPRGWQLTGSTGFDWINQARQRFAALEWVTLAERFCRGQLYRYHDTSTYTPGAGLVKRLTFSDERGKTMPGGVPAAGTRGVWSGTKPGGASGLAVLPASAVRLGINWEKTPEDMITDVQLNTYNNGATDPDADSSQFAFWMWATPFNIDNSALQDAYGFRQINLDTSLSAYNSNALGAAGTNLVNYWLDVDNKWRPTDLQLPDSRALDTAPLLNLLAVDTRGTAALTVPTTTAPAPGLIRSFVMAGKATWTGKKWSTDITLGRTL